jgi:TolB-like protein/DNA-binding winged helix-turn-helix (wHTH) protein/Tfp pilus assembly protein PilF
MKEKTNRFYQFNGFQLEVDEGVLRKGRETVPLTPKAFDTLVVLLENRGRVVEKEILLNEVWADTFVEETTLAQNIFTLRKTLGTSADGKPIIETVPRRGYKFVAPVSELIGSEDILTVERRTRATIISGQPVDANGEMPLAGDKTDAATVKAEKRKSGVLEFFGNRARLLAFGFLLVAITAVSYFWVTALQTRKTADAAAPTVRSIAVLPFQPIDEQSREEKLGLGMADAIIIRLSQLQKIPVRPTSSVFRYVEQPVQNTAAAGRDLSVDAVLEGTVQRDAEQVRISVHLINVRDGKTLWAETYNEKSSNIFALQDSISNKVAQSLALKLTPQQWKSLEQRDTNQPEAFEAYQLGVYFWNKRTEESLNKAASYFQRAVDLDPQFARALAMLADTYYLRGYYGFSDSSEMYKKARVTAERALALDDSIAEAHIAAGTVQLSSGEFEKARQSLERAVALAPYNATAHLRYGWILFRLKNEQAISEMRLAQEYDPLSAISHGALCNLESYRQNFGEAVKACERSYELAPESVTRLNLAYVYLFAGRTADAVKLAEMEVEKSNRKADAFGTLAYFYAKSGRRAEAEAIVRQLKPEAGKNAGLLLDLSLITFALGRKDESFEYFQKAYEKKLVSVMSFENDPMWKDVHEDERFVKLMKE